MWSDCTACVLVAELFLEEEKEVVGSFVYML